MITVLALTEPTPLVTVMVAPAGGAFRWPTSTAKPRVEPGLWLNVPTGSMLPGPRVTVPTTSWSSRISVPLVRSTVFTSVILYW